MDSETALQVAWIGVLAGAAGGGITALVQYVIHRIGSRLRWRDQLRDAAADFIATTTPADMAAMFKLDDHMKLVRRSQLAYGRLALLAPDSVMMAADRVMKRSAQAMDDLHAGQDPEDEQWAKAYLDGAAADGEVFIREVREALKTSKRRA